MRQLQSLLSVLNRRSFFGSLAGAAAAFVDVRSSRGHELLSQAPGAEEAEMEFEIVKGWVLRRQDVTGRN